MSAALHFDEEQSRRVETVYTTSDVAAQRQAVLQVLDLQPGERVLDIGSGPGFVARAAGIAVGRTGAVRGIDLSESMVALARARCADLSQVEIRTGDARALPYADGEFDVAVSTQVYEYLSDPTVALQELYRVLRPGGRALILDTDWDTLVWHTMDTARMRHILAAWSDHCANSHLPRTLATHLRESGFQIKQQAIYPLFNPTYHADTYSYGIIGLIAAYVPSHQGVTAGEASAWAEELRALGQAGNYFFSLNRYLFLVVK
jgi:ubiquinone/menaquinone biosynthesis C-methylase UbiE